MPVSATASGLWASACSRLGDILTRAGQRATAWRRSRNRFGIYRRIGDTAAEAIAHYNLGRAYLAIPAIRDLDAAESAYRRSFNLRDPNNDL